MTVTSAQVTTLLENVLFESATLATANATSWTAIANLSSSTSTVAGLSAYLATQPEAQIAERVVQYYQGALARVPSAFEISYYVAQAEAGLNATQISLGTAGVSDATWASIAAEFAASPEFTKDFGLTGGVTTANAGLIVSGFYANILGRAPSASEISYYSTQLTNGVSAFTLLQDFTQSAEYQSKADPVITNNLATSGTAAVATVAAGGNPLAQGGAPIGNLPTITTNTTFTLTSGQDTQTANTFNATLGAGGTGTATLQGFDVLTGTGSGSTLAIFDTAGNTNDVTVPLGLTLNNVQVVTVSTAENAGHVGNSTFDVSGFSGVTQLTVTSTGNDGDSLVASATASITDTTYGTGGVTTSGGLNVAITDLSSGAINVSGEAGTVSITANKEAAQIAVDDGTTVTVTSNKATTGAVHVGDGTAGGGKPSGAVTVNYNAVETANAQTTGGITIKGGTTVTVNETLTGSSAAIAAGDAGTIGNISITGGAATTSVTVNQSAPGAGGVAVAGKAGVVAVNGGTSVAAAPGVTAITGATKVTGSSSSAAAFGVTDGTVTISDASNTITSVTLSNAAAGSVITSKALSNLTLSGKIAGLTLTDAATAVTLNLNLNKVSTGAITDTNGEIAVLNVVTGGTGSSTLALTGDTTLANLNVSGTQALTFSTALSPANYTALTAIKVSGAAGFKGDISAQADVVTGTVTTGSTIFTTTSSGTVTLTLDSDATHHQTFTGSTGNDVITIGADVVKYAPITAGSGTANELVLTATAGGSYTATKTGVYATGFQILGLNAAAAAVDGGTINLAQWTTGSSFTTLNIEASDGGADTQTISGFAGKTINFNATAGYGSTLVVTAADANGTGDAYTVNLKDANAATGAFGTNVQTITNLTLQDANNVGIGSVSLVTNNEGFDTQDVITTLVDSGLSTLNVSGTGGLKITTFNEGTTLGGTATAATGLTVNNTATGVAGLTIGTFTDNSLGSLTFTGTGNDTVTTMVDGAQQLSITNSGTGLVNIGTLTANNITKLTLGAGVTLGQAIDTSAANVITDQATIGLQTTANGGVSVSGAADNAHVSLTLTNGASAGNTDSITLGNGNNYIVDNSTATTATVNITVGTGSNYIHTGGVQGTATDAVYNITLGTHSTTTGIDSIFVGAAGANFASAPNVIITGAVTGDKITLVEGAGDTLAITSITNTATSVATAVAALEAPATFTGAIGDVTYTTYNGNTYIAENHIAGAAAATTTTVIELIGVHTISSSAAGVITIAS